MSAVWRKLESISLYYVRFSVKRYREGSTSGAVVRALASHQCGPGSNPGVDAICGLSLLLVLSFAPRGFSPGSRSGFPLSSKNQHFQIPFRPGIIDDGTTMWLCNL